MANKTFILFLLCAVVIAGCEGKSDILPTPDIDVDDSAATYEGISQVISANNQFAFDLYNQYKDKEENIFFSPYSISTALAMTYEGAKGKTADEMRDVFYFPEDPEVMQPAFAAVYNQINTGKKDYQLSTANALWAEQNFRFLDEYFNTIGQYYGGKVTNLDFRTQPEESRIIINNWVEEQTNNKIKELLPKDPPVIRPDTRLVLTNAIYFKGTWVTEFDKKDTREEDFHITSEETVKVDMMALTGEEARFNYRETEDLQIIELPYKGEDLSMLVILPKESLESIEFSPEIITDLKSRMFETDVKVYLPKFTFETKYFMAKDLADMGMPTAFSMSADFSGMTGVPDLYIGSVIHQAFVEVNEEGTEAAAATAVVMLEKAVAMQTIFRADHPFIFIIQQRESGNILFMGRVMDPTA